MVTESSEFVVRLLERKSNRTIAELNAWQALSWTERFRRPGPGSLTVLADDVPSAAITLLFDGNLSVQIFREWYRQIEGGEEKIIDQVSGPVDAFEFDTEGDPQFRLSFSDNLIYTTERSVDTDGSASVDPGNVTAIAYIRSLWNSELIAPTDGDRAIDVPATLAGLTAGGTTVDLPVRWKGLADSVEQACIAGEVGVQTSINSSKQIEFSAVPVRDRTSGAADAVILSARNDGAVLRYSHDSRRVRNRIHVLGANEAAARDVEVRTDPDFVTGDRLREMVVDARHLSATAEYQARGDAELSERSEAQRTIDVTEASREFDIRPGDRITVSEWLRKDSTGPDITVDVLCLARTITARPGSVDTVRLEIGSEVPTTGLILKGLEKRGEPARFV